MALHSCFLAHVGVDVEHSFARNPGIEWVHDGLTCIVFWGRVEIEDSVCVLCLVRRGKSGVNFTKTQMRHILDGATCPHHVKLLGCSITKCWPLMRCIPLSGLGAQRCPTSHKWRPGFCQCTSEHLQLSNLKFESPTLIKAIDGFSKPEAILTQPMLLLLHTTDT